jgi:D-alanyl-lipoteichoic acid acyltransferase DltB (MBOAT superfamily)
MLERLFSFKSGHGYAISFTQLDFWLFFLLVMMIFSVLQKKTLLKTIFFTAIGLFFYYKTSGASVLILSFSIILNYLAAKWIHTSSSLLGKKTVMIISVVLNILILGYFKYAFFFTESFNEMFQTDYKALNYFAQWTSGFTGTGSLVDKIIVPAGVSFFTFQSISYTVDVYRKEIEPVKNFFEYSFFITFFPHILLGPIARAKDFIPQITKPYTLTKDDFSWSVIQIVKGLIKKLVIADYIAAHFVDKVIDSPEAYPGFVGVIAMWAYSLQIYGDFSGYTDIATGVSRLMGFRLFQNFDSPYKAINVADFWRRWHRSLGAWLRNYLYIPLGGNKSGGWGTYITTLVIFTFLIFITQWYELIFIYIGITAFYILGVIFYPNINKYVHRDLNLLITMVVGGLWHGPSVNFVMWGTMNGLALILYNYWKKVSPYENKTGKITHFWKIFITFNFITFTRIWFIMQEDDAPFAFLNHIWNGFGFDIPTFLKVISTYQVVFIIMVVGFIFHWLPKRIKAIYEDFFANLPMYLQAVLVAIIVLLIYQAVSDESRGFVYFLY